MEDSFPLVSKELLEALKKLFPDKCPGLDMNDREVWFRSGQVHVVRHLELRFEEQNNPTPKGD